MDFDRPPQAIQIAGILLSGLLACALFALAPSVAQAQSTLIPVPNRRDHVYDPSRGMLLITTANGFVERYDLAARELLDPFEVGVSLTGADTSPDFAFLYVGEGTGGITQGLLRKINLTDGSYTNIAYNRDHSESGVWEVAIGGYGKGLVTTSKRLSTGSIPLRELVLSSDALNRRFDVPGTSFAGQVERNTLISRSADRSLLYLTEAHTAPSLRISYDAVSDDFIAGVDTDGFLTDNLSAVSRDGSLIAMEYEGAISILDPQLNFLETLEGETGVVFHPTEDILFVGNFDEIIIYDTISWHEIERISLGEVIPSSTALDNGVMSISNSGDLLFVSTPSGVRVLNLAPLSFENGFE